MRITDGVHMISDAEETVNAVFVTTEKGTVVIDTMRKPADGQLLSDHIAARTAKPVRIVINTHYHSDHVFGNSAFSAPIVATRTTRELMKSRLGDAWQQLTDDRVPLPMPDITFDDTLTLHFPTCKVHLHELDGHAPGTVAVHVPERSVVHTSDLVFAGRFPFMGDADLTEWIDALRRLESLEAEHVIPGHGRPGGPEILTQQRQWLEHFVDFTSDVAAKGHDAETATEMVMREYDAPEYRRDMLHRVLAKLTER